MPEHIIELSKADLKSLAEHFGVSESAVLRRPQHSIKRALEKLATRGGDNMVTQPEPEKELAAQPLPVNPVGSVTIEPEPDKTEEPKP